MEIIEANELGVLVYLPDTSFDSVHAPERLASMRHYGIRPPTCSRTWGSPLSAF